MKLSIVATLYNSSSHLMEFYHRATEVAGKLTGEDYEIVLVNDGSPDNSLELALELVGKDEHVVVVDLSKNFGHHKAMMAGLEQSVGEKVFLIDSDLEEEPEWLLPFSEQMVAEEADVVYGRQVKRKGSLFEKWSGELFYSVYNWLTDIDHPRNIVTARLMSRRYVDALLLHAEREMVISCLWVITGFKQCEQRVKKHRSSKTTYSLSRKIKHATNAITSFSEVPLRIIFYTGALIFIGSMLYTAFLLFNRLFFAHPMDGWTSVMVSIWILGGLVISFMGIIGIYLSKVFVETKRRPNFIVRGVYGRPNKQD